jgi:hypothetical protein
MKTFERYLIEQKNTHMDHIEDLIFNEGVDGTRKAINFLRNLRDMLAGHTKGSISTTVKWDGAPAIFCGIDPRDGQFFVAKKGVFNKDPKVYKTEADISADVSGDLKTKLTVALQELSKLNIKSGVYQGDLMFTSDDLNVETIDGEKYYTFHPNTILYAVPVNSDLGRKLKSAKMGIVWHTSYKGKSFESMSASFGKSIASKLGSTSSVWHDDATYKDVSGTATFTKTETDTITAILSAAGKTFKSVPGRLLDAFKDNEELRILTKTFINTKIRTGEDIIGNRLAQDLLNYLHNHYKTKISGMKSPRGKKGWEEKRNATMSVFSQYSKKQLSNLFELMKYLVIAKRMIIDKMNQASSIGTFLKTSSGLKVTDQEGFVAIDHLSGGAVKLVNRLEFSRANFSKDIVKGWQR